MSDHSHKTTSKIIEALEQLSPILERDGGGIEFINFEQEAGVLRVRLRGACKGCHFAAMTMEAVIESNIKSCVPDVKKIITVS